MTPSTNFNEYWICSECRTPRKYKRLHAVKKCVVCHSVAPSELKIIKDWVYGETQLIDASRRTHKLRDLTRAAVAPLGINYKESRRLLKDVFDKEKLEDSKQRYAQVFLNSGRYSGYVEEDFCMFVMIPEVAEDMVEKKMMQIRIPINLHTWFKKYAYENDTTMSAVLVNYLVRLRKLSKKSIEPEQI